MSCVHVYMSLCSCTCVYLRAGEILRWLGVSSVYVCVCEEGEVCVYVCVDVFVCV